MGWGLGAVCTRIPSPSTEMWPLVGSLWEGMGGGVTLTLHGARVLGKMWAGVGGQEMDVVGMVLL